MRITRRFSTALCAWMGLIGVERVAHAIERPAGNPAASAWEIAPTEARKRQMYAVVDSVGFWVPFDSVGETFDTGVQVRGGFGWSTHAHAHHPWGKNLRSSFEDAALSSATMVFVVLGTNDVACMRPGELCGDTADTEQERATERAKWFEEVDSAAQALTAAGKCVMWAGPRELEAVTAAVEEPRAFNQMLRDLQVRYPGQFFYVDYHRLSFENAELNESLDGPSGDRIHPWTPAANTAIANLAFESAVSLCNLADPQLEQQQASCDGSRASGPSWSFGPFIPSLLTSSWLWRRARRNAKGSGMTRDRKPPARR